MKQPDASEHRRFAARPGDAAGRGDATAAPASVEGFDAFIKVLVVDDDDFMRELLQRVLTSAGMQVSALRARLE